MAPQKAQEMAGSEILINHEASIRIGVFLCVFVGMALWEVIAPRRILVMSKATRWVNNLGILVVNSFVVRAIFPAAAVGVAIFADERGIGLLHLAEISDVAKVVLAIVA